MSKRRGNNEGSITKRPDGLWEARITLDSGKRKSIYAKTRQEAARRLAAAVRDRDNGALVVADKQSVEQYFNSWLAVMKATIRPRTWETYESYVRLHFLPSLGRMMLTKLTAQQLQLLYAKKLEEGLTTTTVHHLHTIVHKALSNAMRLGLIQRNVCDLIDPPRMRHHEMTTLSEEQARLLLTTASGKRLEALYVLALATGMRQGELLALRWRDVDLDGSTLRVRATLQRTEAGFVFAEPKTAQSRRRIALSKTVVDALRQHKIRQLEERLAAVNVWEDHDLVFPNIIGKPLEAGNVLRRSYWPLLRRAGLPRMRFHDLRHTAATLLLGRGINPKIVSEMLGHSNVSITLTIYSHVTPHMQQQAADAMDAALGVSRCCMVRSHGPAGIGEEERTRVSWVVRAGIARADTLINGYRLHSGVTGLYGFSVQYAAGKSVEELAQAGQFSHAQISYAQEQDLAASLAHLGYTMRLVPSPGKGYHHTFAVLYDATGLMLHTLPQDAADTLSRTFKQRANPHQVR